MMNLKGAIVVLSSVAAVSAAQAQTRDYEQEYTDALASAKEAAGFEWLGTFNRLCVLPPSRGPLSTANEPAGYITDPSTAPPRDAWYAEATQVFDDLYWLGGKQHSGWLIADPEGYILIDTEYPYNSGELILGGMQKLGLDPKMIKYIIVSHAHGDHIGGVELVQDATDDQAVVVMGEADWEMVDTYPNRYQSMTPEREPRPEDRRAAGRLARDHRRLAHGDLVLDAAAQPGDDLAHLHRARLRPAGDGRLLGRHRLQLPDRRVRAGDGGPEPVPRLGRDDGAEGRGGGRHRAHLEPQRVRSRLGAQPDDGWPRLWPQPL